MSITTENLEIVIVTYNRAKYLKETFEQLLNTQSPVKNCDITVIDNNSQDSTQTICEQYARQYANIKYRKNPYNIGWADIAQAFFIAKKEYVWVLADDDYYDWSAWGEVERAMSEGAGVICCCNHILTDEEKKKDLRYVLIQLSLLPAGIYRRSAFSDVTMRNVFDNIYTLFPHGVLGVSAINSRLPITVTAQILQIGIHTEETDCSYTRGIQQETLWPKTAAMSWICGFSNICSGLKDRQFAQETVELAARQPWVYGSMKNFIKSAVKLYSAKAHWNNLADIYINVGRKTRLRLAAAFLLRRARNLFSRSK